MEDLCKVVFGMFLGGLIVHAAWLSWRRWQRLQDL